MAGLCLTQALSSCFVSGGHNRKMTGITGEARSEKSAMVQGRV